ncbi:hypothetical protein AAKU55_003157 [Oxalobacteraceae bacterium GrIS 1.11]
MRKYLAALFTWLLHLTDPRVKSIHFMISNGNTNHKAKHMNTIINDMQKFSLALALVSAAGNAAALASIPTWSSSDPSVVTVTPAADGLTAEVSSTGVPGTATVTASVDGLTVTDDITVTAGPGATLTLTAGEPVNRI